MADTKEIKYINRDFSSLKSALIEYAKAYYPNNYNDFTVASPGSMFLDMAAYVGDILSFYLDNQIQETFLQYATQPKNLYALAYMLGYRPKVTSTATVELDVYQQVPSILSSGNYVPDYSFAVYLKAGATLNSPGTSGFYIPEPLDFSVSGSQSPTEVSVYSVDGGGNPTYFLLKKKTQALAGEVRTTAFTFNQAEKFATRTITDSNIIEILDITDSDGNKWYEVPYLAQDTIMEAVTNIPALVPNYGDINTTVQVPYIAQLKKVPRRFVSRFTELNTLELEFGAGINQVADEVITPNPYKAGIGTLDGLTKLNTAYDPTNFTTTYT